MAGLSVEISGQRTISPNYYMVPPEGTLSVILRAGRDWETVRKLPCQRRICLRLLLYNYL